MSDGIPVGRVHQRAVAAVEMRVEDPDAAAVEVQRIKDELAAAMPTVLSPLGGETPEEQRAEGGEQNQTAEAA
jgi:hypothetical protein